MVLLIQKHRRIEAGRLRSRAEDNQNSGIEMGNPSRSVYIHINGTREDPTPKAPGQFHLNERVGESRLEAIWTNPSESFVERSGGLSSIGFKTDPAVVRGASIPVPSTGSLWRLRIEPPIRAGKGLEMVCNIPGTEVQGCYVTSKILFVFCIFSPN
ncbi:uncharacterized protein N7498_008297 [Penicillium cinerascens]|uniref:Uncharacterized protein n=1 Tax=Penicillium cinerascens TaxID=70096 RepID=A0A9W9MAN0_9EURO|nr:uncharacterized protein N7498_008297 [Penicillium cinerascens]KAJ5194859.1 hypothetical protein N7498_008297 [Penicillium cinerascens]